MRVEILAAHTLYSVVRFHGEQHFVRRGGDAVVVLVPHHDDGAL